MSTVVYFFGAGFSCHGGFPPQAGILSRVRELDLDLFDLPPGTYDRISMDKLIVDKFLHEVFCQQRDPTLEDVFTLLDLSISSHGSCKGYSWRQLVAVDAALRRCILAVFHGSCEQVQQDASVSDFYSGIAAHLIAKRAKAGHAGDPLCVISLNWDGLLENSLYRCIEAAGLVHKVDVDYCCYTTPLSPESPHIPSLHQKAAGLLNVKVLKLHGSSNWLLCPNCNRLYTGLGAPGTAWEQYMAQDPVRACPECERHQPGGERMPNRKVVCPDCGEEREFVCKKCRKPLPAQDGTMALGLQPFFITPTFLKSFDNAHIQMTWHNAYIDLLEAEEVIFVGYSFPEADYHVRALVRRALRPDARVTAVLTERDMPKRNTPKRHRGFFAATRYRDFFGEDRVKIDTSGVEGYFSSLLGNKKLKTRLTSLKKAVSKAIGPLPRR